jgi:hypothetical protein
MPMQFALGMLPSPLGQSFPASGLSQKGKVGVKNTKFRRLTLNSSEASDRSYEIWMCEVREEGRSRRRKRGVGKDGLIENRRTETFYIR